MVGDEEVEEAGVDIVAGLGGVVIGLVGGGGNDIQRRALVRALGLA